MGENVRSMEISSLLQGIATFLVHFLVFLLFYCMEAGRNHSTLKKCSKKCCRKAVFCLRFLRRVVFAFRRFYKIMCCLCCTAFSSFGWFAGFFRSPSITRTARRMQPLPPGWGKFSSSGPPRTENFCFRFRKHFFPYTVFHIDLLKSSRFFCVVCAPFCPAAAQLSVPSPPATGRNPSSPERHTHATNQTDAQTVQDRRSRAKCAEQCQPRTCVITNSSPSSAPAAPAKLPLLNIIGGLDRYDSGDFDHQRHFHQKVHRPRLGLLPQPHHRLCVPELQPHPPPDRAGQLWSWPSPSPVFPGPSAAAAPPRHCEMEKVGPGQPAAQAPQRDVRRPDAACGHCPCTGEQPPTSCWPSRPPVLWTVKPASRSWSCSRRWPGTVWWSWSPITRSWPSATPPAS